MKKLQIYALFLLILSLFKRSDGQDFDITDCQQLQMVIVGNSTVRYFVKNDIDCVNYNFSVI